MFDPEKPPELEVLRWVNARQPLTLAGLREKVVVLTAFQMLCPGCVEHGLPQAKRIRERFHPDQVAVIGLHTVFEHHAVMTPAALEVFQGEYKWPFPIAIDKPDGDGVPRTMAAYRMQGTPTLLVFDRGGRLRRHYFGRPDDMMIAAEIMGLAIEDKHAPREQAASIERKIAATVVVPGSGEGQHRHHHAHGDDCGCDHDHSHDHDHGHHHHLDQPASGDREAAASARTQPKRP